MDASILLYSGTNLFSWIIKKLTKSTVSHAAWIDNDHEIIEAEAAGVQKNPWSEYPAERIAIIKLNLPDDVIQQCLDFARSQIGHPYDFKLFIKLGWRLLWGWSRKNNISDWPKDYICSELLAKPLYQIAGINMNPDVGPSNVTPGDILRWAKANTDKATITWVGSKI